MTSAKKKSKFLTTTPSSPLSTNIQFWSKHSPCLDFINWHSKPHPSWVISEFCKIHKKSPVLFFNKFSGHQPATLFNKRLQRKCFPVNSAKFLIILFNKTPHTYAIYAKTLTHTSHLLFTHATHEPMSPMLVL